MEREKPVNFKENSPGKLGLVRKLTPEENSERIKNILEKTPIHDSGQASKKPLTFEELRKIDKENEMLSKGIIIEGQDETKKE